MKKIYLLVSALALSISAFAQAPVPTSYDFENGGTYPTGWTLNPLGVGSQYYTTSFACGNSAYSLKLDTDGENLVVALSSQPGVVSYNIRANTGSTTPWNGDMQIQESVNGTTWTKSPGEKMTPSKIAGFHLITIDLGNFTTLSKASFNQNNANWDNRNSTNFLNQFKSGANIYDPKSGTVNQTSVVPKVIC